MDKVYEILKEANLDGKYIASINAGKSPYKRNRKVLVLFDIDEDRENGIKEAKKLLGEIDGWIKSFEKLRVAASQASGDVASISEREDIG